MLAVVKENEGQGFIIKKVNIPKPKANEVLIKVKVVGICGTDIPIFKGLRRVPIPLIPGHEFAGEVVEKGKEVKKFKIGDRVTAAIVISCGNCYYCKSELETLCDNIIETGIDTNGAFAEYVSVPEKVVYSLPNEMTFEQGASIDPIASAYHAIRKVHIDSKDRIAIFGPGPIGLYTLQILKSKNVKNVVMIGLERNKKRLELAEKLGADYIINIEKDNLLESISKITNGRMLDTIIDATGSHHGFQLRIDAVRKHGTVVILGIPHELVTTDISKIVRSEINIHGSICYSGKDFEDCINLVKLGKINIESMISHRLSLKDMEKALSIIEQGYAMKILLYP